MFMIGSLLPFAIVQGVAFTKDKAATKTGAVVALCSCILTFVVYSAYTIRQEGVMATKAKMVHKKRARLRYFAAVKKQYMFPVNDNEDERMMTADVENTGAGAGVGVARKQSMAERFQVTSRDLFGGRSGIVREQRQKRPSLNRQAMNAMRFFENEFKKNDPINIALKQSSKAKKKAMVNRHSFQQKNSAGAGEAHASLSKKGSMAKMEQTEVAKKLIQNIGKPSENFVKKRKQEVQQPEEHELHRQGTLDILMTGVVADVSQVKVTEKDTKSAEEQAQDEDPARKETKKETKKETTEEEKKQEQEEKINIKVKSLTQSSVTACSTVAPSSKKSYRRMASEDVRGRTESVSRRRASSMGLKAVHVEFKPFAYQSDSNHRDEQASFKKKIKLLKRSGAKKETLQQLAFTAAATKSIGIEWSNKMKQRVHEMGQIALALAQQGDGENLIRVRKAFLRLMNTGSGR
jgi:hypothetical protein